MISDLARLEAKAKALVGTQHWRGLDPNAVLEALAKVERLRAENTVLKKHLDLYEVSDNLVIKNEDEIERLRAKLKEYNELSPIVQKLTQAHAALEWYATASYSHASLGVHKDDCYTCDMGKRARQALKEIDE